MALMKAGKGLAEYPPMVHFLIEEGLLSKWGI